VTKLDRLIGLLGAIAAAAGWLVHRSGSGKGPVIILSNKTNSELVENVAGRVGVVVHPSVEGYCSFLSNISFDVFRTTRMLNGKFGDIMDSTVDDHELISLLHNLIEYFASDDWQLICGDSPVQSLLLLVQHLLLHLNLPLLDNVVIKNFEVVRLADIVKRLNDPFGGVILVKLDGVSVVIGELVVEVVVTLAKSQQGCDDTVAGGVFISKRSKTPEVSQGVHHEGVVVDEELAEHGSVVEASPEIAPNAGDRGGEHCSHDECERAIVLVLPPDPGVGIQILNARPSNLGGVLLEEHPSNVRVPESAVGIVGVTVSISVSVVSSVVTAPPSNGALYGTSTEHEQDEFGWLSGIVCLVGPEPVITSGDTNASEEIKKCGPCYGVGMGSSSVHSVEGSSRGEGEDSGMQPVNVA